MVTNDTRAEGNQRQEYLSRINRVIDHIEANLDRELRLEKLAKVANFSPFHFHRIFSAMLGETLSQFIQRLRVEKAANQLTTNHKKSITEIALDCGFSSSATFARAFKESFGMSASQWRSSESEYRKMSKTDRNHGQSKGNAGKASDYRVWHIGDINNYTKWRIEMTQNKSIHAEVEVKKMPSMDLAYVRHVGPYVGDSKVFEGLFTKLMSWAGPRGLLRFPQTKCLCVYHDDPKVTDEKKLRTSACITVDADTEVEGEVGKMKIQGGNYAVARFEISAPEEFGMAWDAVMGGWLPDSGYQPDDRPCFEMYHNNHKDHPEQKHIFDICVPVKPL